MISWDFRVLSYLSNQYQRKKQRLQAHQLWPSLLCIVLHVTSARSFTLLTYSAFAESWHWKLLTIEIHKWEWAAHNNFGNCFTSFLFLGESFYFHSWRCRFQAWTETKLSLKVVWLNLVDAILNFSTIKKNYCQCCFCKLSANTINSSSKPVFPFLFMITCLID